jgi:hypothetical protein
MDNRILKGMSRNILLVKTARIKLPQTVEVELNNGEVVIVAGEAAREPINAIALAKQTRSYHSTFALPSPEGEVMVVAVDGKKLDATIQP